MLITDQGTLVRFKVDELSIIGRNTQGVRLINVAAGEHVVGMQRIEESQESPDSEDHHDEQQSDGDESEAV